MPHKHDLYVLAVNPSQEKRISGLVGVIHNYPHSNNGKDKHYLVVQDRDFFKIMVDAPNWMGEGEGFAAYHSKRNDLSTVLPDEILRKFKGYIHSLDQSMASSSQRTAISVDEVTSK